MGPDPQASGTSSILFLLLPHPSLRERWYDFQGPPSSSQLHFVASGLVLRCHHSYRSTCRLRMDGKGSCPRVVRSRFTSRRCCISMAPHPGRETHRVLSVPFPSPSPLPRSLLSLELSISLVSFRNSLGFLEVFLFVGTTKYF